MAAPRTVALILKRAALGLALAALGWLAASALVLGRLTQRFERAPREVAAPPGTLLREVRTQASDGLSLCAWVLEVPRARGAVLALHGSGDSRRVWIELLPHLAAQGLSAVLPDLRAHGVSEGEFNDFGWSARRDVHAWTSWMDEHQADLPRVVIGTSMGAAALLFAAQEGDLGALGYALDACYRDLDTAQRQRLDQHLPPPLAVLAALGLRCVAPLYFEFDVDERTPLAAARALAARGGPRAIVTGASGDAWATPDEQRELAAALGPGAELVLFDGQGHFATSSRDPARYVELVASLFGD